MRATKKIGSIHVENVPCYCSIGIHEEEKKMGQKLLIDAHFDVDLSQAISEDDVKHTISYVDIYKGIQKIGQSKPHSLVETLADEIVETFLRHPLVLKAKVRICKPHIPFKDFQGDVSVEIERSK